MKKAHFVAVIAGLTIAGTALADGPQQAQKSQPVQLTVEQMDNVTAARGYGKTLIDVTGYSFGQLIGPSKKAGTSTHSNYAGGVKALVQAALAGAHPLPQ